MTVPHMTAIGALVAEVRRAYMDEMGVELSYGDIARRSRGPQEGKGLTRGRVQQIATGEIKRMPDRQTVEQLARGLRVPASVVVERYMETLGVDQRRGSPATTDLATLIATDPTLSDAARAHFLNQYRLLQQLSAMDVSGASDEQRIRDSDLPEDQKSRALAQLRRNRERRARGQEDQKEAQ